MTKRTIMLIDGGHLRAVARGQKINFDPDFIEDFAQGLSDASGEDLMKVLYYDARPYNGVQKKPVSREEHSFSASGDWLDELAKRDLFAVRLGQLKFRGWVLKAPERLTQAPEDKDFSPSFEQKGVDMRIGLDIALISSARTYDRIILVSADTDIIPALKEARRAGIQVVLTQLPLKTGLEHRQTLRDELRSHGDFHRLAEWPKTAAHEGRANLSD